MNILYYDPKTVKMPEPNDSDDSGEDHFISIGKDSRLKKGHMIDIYVSLITDITHKIIIHINEYEKMSTLLYRVNENFEMKYEHLRGLSGLQAKDLKKVTGNINLRKTKTSSNVVNQQIAVPIEGRIKDHLKGNDHILCDVDSLDIWIKFKFSLDSINKSLESELELKVDKDMLGSGFMQIVQKLTLQIWNQYLLDSSSGRQNNYIMTYFKAINAEIGSTRKSETNSPEKKGSKKLSKQIPFDLALDKKVGEIFTDYSKNGIKVQATFQTVQQVYQTQYPGQKYTMSNAVDFGDNSHPHKATFDSIKGSGIQLQTKNSQQLDGSSNTQRTYRVTFVDTNKGSAVEQEEEFEGTYRELNNNDEKQVSHSLTPMENYMDQMVNNRSSNDNKNYNIIAVEEEVEDEFMSPELVKKTSQFSKNQDFSLTPPEFPQIQQVTLQVNAVYGNLILPRKVPLQVINATSTDESSLMYNNIDNTRRSTEQEIVKVNEDDHNILTTLTRIQEEDNDSVASFSDKRSNLQSEKIQEGVMLMARQLSQNQNNSISSKALFGRADKQTSINDPLRSVEESIEEEEKFDDENGDNMLSEQYYSKLNQKKSFQATSLQQPRNDSPSITGDLKQPLMTEFQDKFFQQKLIHKMKQHQTMNMEHLLKRKQQRELTVKKDRKLSSRGNDFSISNQKVTQQTTESKGDFTLASSTKKKSIFGNLFNKIRLTRKIESAKNMYHKRTLEQVQEVKNLTEEEMQQKIALPDFLLAQEDYQDIKIPPMKNFNYKERNDRDTIVSILESQQQQDEDHQIIKRNRNFIIVVLLILLAAGLAVGIFFLVTAGY